MMNKEQRAQYVAEIQNLEGLLAYAVAHNEVEASERIRAELVRIVEGIQQTVSFMGKPYTDFSQLSKRMFKKCDTLEE